MEQNKIYYSNEEGKGSRVTRDLVTKLFIALSENLSSKSFLSFLSRSRVPNERELYGLFIKSLIDSCGNELGHIATEFQVVRASDDTESEGTKGRVDLIFDFRSVSFLVELKVGRINAFNDDREPKIRAREIWYKAIEQLDELSNDSVHSLLQNKVVKLPIVLYFLESRDKNKSAQDVDHEKKHQTIFDFLNDKKSKFKPDFELYSDIPPTWTRLRKTGLKNDETGDVEDHNNCIYGFSVFAKQMNDE
ncbi:hypothetical protein ACH5Y9_07705 [Methylomonas sp. BW4-1]|uniref:hypothetical protein n=1 Tax=Methylomonas sp. BW4-1 TaxID=3376685 RepID=UPI0040414B8C